MEQYQDYLTVAIDQDRNLITSHWFRFVRSDEFRAGMSYIQECIVKDKLAYWLVNMTHTTAPVMGDQAWMMEHIMEVLEKTAMKKIAFVVPGDFTMDMIWEKLCETAHGRFGKKIMFECFSRPDHALYWFGSHEEAEMR